VAEARPPFDPVGLLGTLQRHQVTYIVVGALGRVLQGADEITGGVDIVPATKGGNLERLDDALRDLNARRPDGREVGFEQGDVPLDEPVELMTDRGELKVILKPAGTRGYDDLRKAATREGIGRGVRPAVASIDDLARMLAALGREEDRTKLRDLRRLAEMERGLALEL
jgi:hypothetical protein